MVYTKTIRCTKTVHTSYKQYISIISTRFVVKPEGEVGNVFVTKPVGVNENLRGWQASEGRGLNPQTPDKSSTEHNKQAIYRTVI